MPGTVRTKSESSAAGAARTAAGTVEPSSTVVIALSAALTLIAMAPVGVKIAERMEPVLARSLADPSELIANTVEAVREPLRSFLSSNASAKERESTHSEAAVQRSAR